MAKVKVTIALGRYDRTQPLIDGDVRVAGAQAKVLPFSDPGELFHRMLRFGEFDVSEMSMASYLLAYEKKMPFVAIPVFPRRVFRHSSIYVRADSGIATPKDLEGRRVGIAIYQNTAAVWVRGILKHHHGVNLEKITWVSEEPEGYRIETRIPPSVRIEQVHSGRTLEEALLDGDADAVIAPGQLKSFVAGSKEVVRLFSNYRQVEEEYYRKTGIFPIHHTVVMKKELNEKNPWLAVNLVKAFREAKMLCYNSRYSPGRYSLAWASAWLNAERQVLGDDPWPYDLGEPNRLNIDTLAQYAHEQGIIKKKPAVEKMFVESCLAI